MIPRIKLEIDIAWSIILGKGVYLLRCIYLGNRRDSMRLDIQDVIECFKLSLIRIYR